MSLPRERQRPGVSTGRYEKACLGGQPNHNANVSDAHARNDDWTARLLRPVDELFQEHVSFAAAPNLLGWAGGAQCPFCHQRKFAAQLLGRGNWQCTACQRRGDLIGFLRQLRKCSYGEALHELTIKPKPTVAEQLSLMRALYKRGGDE